MTTLAVDSAVRSLEQLLAPDQIVSDRVALLTYDCDAGLDHGMPLAVVFPRTTEDVIAVMRWAVANDVPLVARGAGTGLSGGAVAEHGGIIVEFARMDETLRFDDQNGMVVVQPGAVTLHLDQYVREYGWYYPPDPSSGRASSVGGNIAENSGGPHCFKYGVTANYVQGLEAVLADGQRVQMGGPALDYPEYDFTAIMTGSEGTLSLLTAAHLRLIAAPPAVKTAIAAFDTVERAGNAVSDIISQGLMPATMEMMDQSFMRIIEDFSPSGLPVESGAALIIEVDGYPSSVDPQMDEIVTILNRHINQEVVIAHSEAQRASIWYGRKSAAGAMARLAPKFYLVDGTVPRSKLADALAKTNQICTDYELRVVYVFHAGDGNLHPLILIPDPKDADLMRRIHAAGHDIMKLCVDYGGSITGEHGVGIEKRAFMPIMYSPAELRVMRDIKAVFDPHERLNPAKIFPVDTPDPEPLPAPTATPSDQFAPQTAEEAAEAIHAWTAQGRRIRVQGNGTKSRALPAADVMLSTANLTGIETIAREELYVRVKAGTLLTELQEELRAVNMWVPLASPWADATVGGIVATAWNAPLRMRYGSLRDNLLAATLALPNGRAIAAGRPVVKNVAGYDLPKLLVGSHGTLGLLADVTLKLYPTPRRLVSLCADLGNDRHAALDLVVKMRRQCLVSSGLLLCRGADVAASVPELADAGVVLVYTGEGYPQDVDAEVAAVAATLQAAGATRQVQRDNWQGTAVWAGVLAHDAAIPVRVGATPHALSDLLMLPELADAPFVADVASGLLYLSISASSDVAAILATLRAAVQPVHGYACAPAHAGSTSFEPWGFQPDSLPQMRALKQQWDTQGLLNPGAFVV